MISTQNKAGLNGLVLAGGRSTRMGFDKAMIEYHKRPQYEFMTELLAPLTDEVFISCREDQVPFFSEKKLKTIPDRKGVQGPLGAIYSTLLSNPSKAWLVIAVDLPLMDHEMLMELIRHRDPTKIATAFISPFDNKPEPLIAIWEPSALTAIESGILQDFHCPRKVMMFSEISLLESSFPEKLTNVNFPEEAEKFIR